MTGSIHQSPGAGTSGSKFSPSRTLAVIARTRVPGFKSRVTRNAEETLDLLNEDTKFMRELCGEFDGRIAKRHGDGIEVVFINAANAVSWAAAFQRSLQKKEEKEDRSGLKHSIGLHLGEIYPTNDGLVGEGFEVAKELADKAEAGIILLTQPVYKRASDNCNEEMHCLGPMKLNNAPSNMNVYRVKAPTQISSKLAAITIRKAVKGLEKHRSAGITSAARFHTELRERRNNLTVSELVDLILRDTVVTARVLSLSNHPEYNPTGKSINSVSQAIHMLGLTRIQKMTLKILSETDLSEEENNHQSMISATAFASGALARSMANSIGQANPEEAFIAASLRHFGKIIMSNIMHDDYERAIEQTKRIGADNAFKKIFGLTPEDLGRYLLARGDSLPRQTLGAIEPYPPARMGEPWNGENESLHAIAESAVEICNLAANRELPPRLFQQETNKTLLKFGIHNLDSNDVKKHLHEFASDLDLLGSLDGCEAFTELSNTFRNRFQNKDMTNHNRHSEEKENATRSHSTSRLADEVSNLVTKLADPTMTTAEFNRRILKTISQSTDLKNCVILQENGSPGRFITAMCTGNLPDLAGASINLRIKSVFSVCMERDQELFIEDARDERYSRHIPAWIMANNPASALILPVKDMGRPRGFICATSEYPTVLKESDIRQLRALRILLGLRRRLEVVSPRALRKTPVIINKAVA